MTQAQWQLVLEAVDNCTQCMAHMPELSYDIMPINGALAQLQVEWQFAAFRASQYD